MFKRLKNIENAKKGLINGVNKNKNKKNQNNNIDTKPLNVFDYLKSLSQEAEDLMDEIMQADADKDINIYKLVFIGSNRKKFNFDILGCH